jgi:hypothetical protein
MTNVVKFPYNACRRVHSRKPPGIEKRHARGMGRQSRGGNSHYAITNERRSNTQARPRLHPAERGGKGDI